MKRWSNPALCATRRSSPVKDRKRRRTVETDGARRSSSPRRPVRRRPVPGVRLPGSRATGTSRRAPARGRGRRRSRRCGRVRPRARSSPGRRRRTRPLPAVGHVVLRQEETVVPAKATRLSPAVSSANSEWASPSEMEGVAKSERAASTADSGPRSSSMSTNRSRASSASCTRQIQANICSLGKTNGSDPRRRNCGRTWFRNRHSCRQSTGSCLRRTAGSS